MKRFSVKLYFHGCYSVDVEAKDENEARQIATEQAMQLNNQEFLEAIELIEEGHDVYEL